MMENDDKMKKFVYLNNRAILLNTKDKRQESLVRR